MVQQQEEPSDDEEMEIDETNLNEQIEVSTLNFDSLTKLDEQLDEILKKPTNVEHFDLDSDNRYGDFADCIEQMKGREKKTSETERKQHRSVFFVFLFRKTSINQRKTNRDVRFQEKIAEIFVQS